MIKLYPDKILRSKCTSVVKWDNDLFNVIDTLESIIIDRNAVEISAPQIGIPLRIFTIFLNGKPVTFINPEIKEIKGKNIHTREQCISLPFIKVVLRNRYSQVIVEARDKYKVNFTLELHNEYAIAAQHAIDHLNGILIIDHMKPLHRRLTLEKYHKKMKKMNKVDKKFFTSTIQEFKEKNRDTLYDYLK